MSTLADRLTRPRYSRWFSAHSRDSEGWYGPHRTLEAAILEAAINRDDSSEPVYVMHGRKTTKAEQEEGFHPWEVDSDQAFEVRT